MRPSRAALLASAAAATLSACGASTVTHDTPTAAAPVHLMDARQRQAEYADYARIYPWALPQGVSFPATLKPPEEPTMFEVGEGRNQADTFWICAWMGRWLRTRTNEAAASRAWARVLRSDQTQLHTLHYYDPTHIWDNQILEPAAHGHPEQFIAFYETSCDFPELPATQSPPEQDPSLPGRAADLP